MSEEKLFTAKEWRNCLKVLRVLSDNPFLAPDENLFKGLIGKINKTARKTLRQQTKKRDRTHDAAILSAAEAVTNFHGAKSPEFVAENPRRLKKAIKCYVCNQLFAEVHFFYHKLCPTCAALNFAKRSHQIDLTGRVVLLTGGRIKVGFQTALKFLRSGARVILTTRFPVNAAHEYANESDYSVWQNRLNIYGLDLRNIFAVENFIEHLRRTESHLDILINNAAQTIKYPNVYYLPLIEREKNISKLTPAARDNIATLNESLTESPQHFLAKSLPNFPLGETDRFGQPLDLRTSNSWTARLDEIETAELVEVNLINHIAPFLLIGKLKSLMQQSPFERRFVVNVTSSEGQFSYRGKTVFHPHTNMTKAALNMLTKTSASDYLEAQIYLNSVDVGWMSSGKPHEKLVEMYEKGFTPPLDLIDGAARIYDVICQILEGREISGQLLKNYFSVEW